MTQTQAQREYPSAAATNDTSEHVVVGFFDTPSNRSTGLIKSLHKRLGTVRSFLTWDHPTRGSKEFCELPGVTVIPKEQLVEFCAERFAVEASLLRREAEVYKPLYKIYLLRYLRAWYGLSYCLMVDNDIFLFRDIPEIRDLSRRQTSFLIPETGCSCRLQVIDEFIAAHLQRAVRYSTPNRGFGYNSGMCGIDLTVFDALDGRGFQALVKLLSEIGVWWKEQAFIVSLLFSREAGVYTFPNERYLFMPHDHPLYSWRSRVYHCIYCTDKTVVDKLYQCNNKKWMLRMRARAWILRYWAVGGLRRLLLPACRLAARMVPERWHPRRPNANRYRQLLEYVSSHHCRRILEVGVWRGDTACLLLLNSKNREVEYHGIDVFEKSSEELIQHEVSLRPDSMRRVKRRLRAVSRNIHLHNGFSSAVFRELQKAGFEFDCIWLDGGHSYETVKSDFEQYSQLLGHEGTIFLDDYTEDPHLPDVKRYVDSELLNRKDIEVAVCTKYTDVYRMYEYRVVQVSPRGVKGDAQE